VQQLEQQLAEKDAALQDVVAKYRDAQREFDEARVRLRKDVQRDVERGRRAFLADLLDVVDNLDRAIDAARSSTEGSSLGAGIELVRRQFLGKLESAGVVRFESRGERFDPARHEAVTVTPAADPSQDGLIVGVIAPGYQVGDEILRPAQVAVARLG
jgi:molecular chaperone GrpE